MAYNNIIDREGAEGVIPEELSTELIKSLQNKSISMEAFKRIPVARGQVRVPVLDTLPVVEMIDSDTGLKPTTEIAWKNKYLNVKEFAATVPVPEAVQEDVDIDVWESIEPLLVDAIARAADNAILFGVNTSSQWPTAVVTAAKEAENYVKMGTASTEHGGVANDIAVMMGKVEEGGFSPDYFAANVLLKAKLRNARTTFGEQLQEVSPTEIYGNPVVYPARGLWPTAAEKATLIAIEKEQFVVGIRTDIQMKFLDQAVITDQENNIQFNLATQDMVALRIRFRMGWQVSNQITYDQPEEAKRYPAGILGHE